MKRPLVFTLEALSRYPMQSRIAFIECGGNSARSMRRSRSASAMAAIHGLLGCSEWTGVKLSTLLDEAGVEPSARWLIAEGADSAAMSRSIPLAKAMDDALVCLYQNGERVRPSNGYPVRLLLPGFEGNMNVKWLRRIKLDHRAGHDQGRDLEIHDPAQRRESLAIRVSDGGEIHHHASGAGTRAEGTRASTKFPVSPGRATAASDRSMCRPMADEAGRRRPCRARSCPRRRCASAQPWQWNGGPAVLQSRATDDTGMVQPTRAPVCCRARLAWRLPLQCHRKLAHR